MAGFLKVNGTKTLCEGEDSSDCDSLLPRGDLTRDGVVYRTVNEISARTNEDGVSAGFTT